MSAVPDRLRENLAAVRDRITEACRHAGRRPDEVRLVGVTKYVTADLAGALVSAGCADVAESRPQSLWAKAAALADAQPAPRWHLVGHLQRNKVRRTVGVVSLLHSLDSMRLAETIELEAAALGLTCDALVEVNLADDPGRSGVPAAELEALLVDLAGLPHLRVRGLMGMASVPKGSDARGTARRQFAALREMRDALRPRLPPGVAVEQLSMGMSDDFEDAILEGATLVRIGSRLWEGIAS